MDNTNTLLQPTGQATPQTVNQQSVPGLNLTQTDNSLQPSNNSLYFGDSSQQITVPRTSATAIPSQDNSSSQPTTSGQSSWILILVVAVVCVVILGFLVRNLTKRNG